MLFGTRTGHGPNRGWLRLPYPVVQPLRLLRTLPARRTMTSTPHEAAPPSLPLDALEAALEQSHDLKAKVEAVADDLASANDVAKDRIADGATTLPAAQVLQAGVAVELTVQECADDLQQVTRNLAHGVDEVKAVEQVLSRSREALAESETALTASRDAERAASYRPLRSTCRRARRDPAPPSDTRR